MSAEEYAIWEAEYQRSPWGDVRADFQAGQVCATVFNMQGKVAADGESVTALDFMPFVRQPDKASCEPDVAAHFGGLKGA